MKLWKKLANKFSCLATALLFLFCLGQSSAIGEDLSFPERLDRLESALGLPPNGGSPLLIRTESLEQRIFGSSRSGSLADRLLGLEAASLSATTNNGAETNNGGNILNTGEINTGNINTGNLNTGNFNYSVPPNTAPALSDKEKSNRTKELIKSAQITKIVAVGNTSPPHFFRIPPPSQTEPVTSDYLDFVMQASKNRVFRFKVMPIPVYIAQINDVSLSKAVKESFFDWESRGAQVKFVEVKNPNDARIRVTWRHLGMSSDQNDCTLGAHTITKWTKHPSGKVALMSVSAIPVPIYIPRLGAKYSVPPQEIEVNVDLINSKVPEARYLLTKNIIAHELGHALGLLGHSPEKGDLMYSITDEHSRLSQRDLNTLQKLYQKKVDVPL